VLLNNPVPLPTSQEPPPKLLEVLLVDMCICTCLEAPHTVTKSAMRYLVDVSRIAGRELLATSLFGASLGDNGDGKLNAILLGECKNIRRG
jgi:hypothetical protein